MKIIAKDVFYFLLKQRVVRFLLTGVFTTLIDFAIFYFLHFIYQLAIIPSNTISYGIGIISGFFINRAWTFHDAMHRSHKRVVLSLLYGYLGLAINTAIVWYLSFFIHAMLAKVIAVLIILVYNYFTNKYLVFRVQK